MYSVCVLVAKSSTATGLRAFQQRHGRSNHSHSRTAQKRNTRPFHGSNDASHFFEVFPNMKTDIIYISSKYVRWELSANFLGERQVRAVQRRLGMLACASELSAGFKEELRGVRTALQQQAACNVAVDSVVSEQVNNFMLQEGIVQ